MDTNRKMLPITFHSSAATIAKLEEDASIFSPYNLHVVSAPGALPTRDLEYHNPSELFHLHHP